MAVDGASLAFGLTALLAVLFALMAVDSDALTLADYAKYSNEPLVRAVSFSLIEEDGVLSDLPLMTKASLIANGARFQGDALPAVNWAKINEEPDIVSAVPTPFQEQVYIIRNGIDTDNKLVKDINQFSDPRAVRLQAYLKSVRYDVNDKFINNNHLAGDGDCFVGIRARLDTPSVYGCESELKINGGGVDMTQGAMSAGSANNFIELVDELLYKLGAKDGSGVVLYVNEVLERRFARAIRMLGAGAGFTMTMDAFDRPVAQYRNAKIRCIGRKKDQTTQIITNTEDTAGANGASTYTSLYGVRYGEDQLTGWQMESLEQSVRDLGLINNGVTYRTVIDWAIGLYAAHTRCLGRIYGIKMS